MLFPACWCVTRRSSSPYSEGQIGWIPYILERADDVWVEHRAWGGVQDVMTEPPSHLLPPADLRLLLPRPRTGSSRCTAIGVDNVTFETDYPHTDSTWPHTRKLFEEQVADLDDETVYKIARGNAIRMLRLPLDR